MLVTTIIFVLLALKVVYVRVDYHVGFTFNLNDAFSNKSEINASIEKNFTRSSFRIDCFDNAF